MTRKTLKIALVSAAAMLITLTAGVVVASTKAKAELPEYLGPQACIGCHSDKFLSWETSLHANFVTEIKTVADLPADPSGLSPELQDELAAAKYVFHGNRFLTPDLVTGELKYVGVEYDDKKQEYVASTRKGSSWDASCGGCHAGKDFQSGIRTSIGVGCESCHGPARDHVLGRGDRSKISVSVDPSESCAACHSGFNTKAGAARFPVGYRPGMNLEEIGFIPATVDASKPAQPQHHKGAYPQWKASAHAGAAATLNNNPGAKDRCYGCHSTTFINANEAGQPISVKDHPVDDGVTCVTCHDPHGSANEKQLKKPAKELCTSCHTGEPTPTGFAPGKEVHHPQAEMLAGVAAIGIAPTEGPHTPVSCEECHMTGGNHLFKVVKPGEVIGTTTKDTCTTCHTNSTPEVRDVYLSMWQESVEAKLEALKADIAVVDTALKANPSGLADELKASYAAAKTNFSMVEADASKGAHNFEYAIKILTAAKKDIRAAKEALGK
ncbi:MAG TPA: ammonia-forming cytochrome c nitrite reductase subunit c552 [Symbiobacteriaceae bacterium]|nr:ammonia-forming cytochrome c nitrite reductase subunit c552 [Symbiobacteriaceae bacterium]